MATYRYCPTHGKYEGKACPKCAPPKTSKKYGGRVIHIPPHMKARS